MYRYIVQVQIDEMVLQDISFHGCVLFSYMYEELTKVPVVFKFIGNTVVRKKAICRFARIHAKYQDI